MLMSVSTVSLAELVPLLAAFVMCGLLPAILQSLTNVLTLFLDTFISDFKDSTVTYTKAPPSPDYVYGPEHTPSPVYVPEFVLKPVYLKFMPLEDDVLLAEELPLHAAVSPTADSPGYIPESDPKEDPEEDPKEDDEDPEEDPANYPTDRDDMRRRRSHPEMRLMMRRRMRTIQSYDNPAKSRNTIYSHPPPPIALPHTKAYVAILRAAAPSTYILAPQSKIPPYGTPPLLPIPLPTSSPPLILPSVGESSSAPTARPTGGFRAYYGFVDTLDDEIRQDPKREVDYGITDTWDEMLVGMSGAPTTDETEL
nr:hypothetical protein [Tanacetum cinerariifolium]